MKKNNILVNNSNIRVIKNDYGIKYQTGANHKKHIRGNDILDTSSQYKASMKIASSYNNTSYVKYNNKAIKLNNYIKMLRKNRIQYDIKNHTLYYKNKRTGNIENIEIFTSNKIKIKYTSKDYKLAKILYNY